MAEERRLVTILFADVVGSTAMSESLDPEDVRALLGRLFAIARDAIEQHGGRVEKFIGDAIMAVFGLPAAHEDDAARALSAALDLRDRVRADPVLGERVPIRLGVTGGEVIATREADAREFLITGDPVNSAARLQQAAEPWSIIVGERTVRATANRFRFGPPLAVEAKGKAEPIAARQLEGLAESGIGRPRGRIVGRDADLDQLELVARRTFAERRPFLVSIVAPAGAGKSRLLEEFLDRLDAEVRVAIAQCLPYGQRLTFWPMRQILLSIVGLPDDSTPEGVVAALGPWLREAGDPDAERTAELLAATIGASEAEGDRIGLFAAWRRFVELAAERSPLVLVIEDLHWSSDSLLDLVESMLQPRADVPLVMIALARPELLDRRPAWGGGRRNGVSIALEPLPSPAVAALVADLLDNPAPEIVAAVVERAEGNPFYAGEIVRSLEDRLGPKPDPSAVASAIAALPDTVHGTVLARLDALEPAARRVVQLGAVLGRTFHPGAIPALDPSLGLGIVATAVDDLLDRDLIRSSGRDAVTFRHILIREVAYGTLPRAERARLHGDAGRWLDAQATATGREDELAELVAFHLREAVTIGTLLGEAPPGDLAGLAVRWLRRAAESAAAAAATPEAARHLNAAIELASHDLLPDMHERLGQIWRGGEQAADAFERAWALGRELELGADQELRTLAQLLVTRARWTGSIGRQLDEADRERRYSIVARLLDDETSPLARLYGTLAMAFRPMAKVDMPTAEELAASATWAMEAVASAELLDDPNLLSGALDAAAVAPMSDGRMAEVLPLIARRHEVEDRLTTEERTDAWIMHAWCETLLGKLDVAERAADRARAGLLSGQASAWVLGATAWRALTLHALGRWDEALLEAGRAERAWQESELRAPGFALNGFLAAFAIARSRGDLQAADHWRELGERIYQHTDPIVQYQRLMGYLRDDVDGLEYVVSEFRVFAPRLDYVHLALASLADRRHPTDVSVLDSLIAYAEERGLLLISSQARRLRGLTRDDARDLQAALPQFERMGALPYIARTRAELGLATGNEALMTAGIDELAALGDVEHVARLISRRNGARASR
ncbi:MAG TPA: adenylate/guanylate cyclase domain-containing protein [Candidatus Limnocylindria bacterium]|nr:adenylate/guanylate cyclase domain-containing protein [Candidatus Limnocylindria bacterium]